MVNGDLMGEKRNNDPKNNTNLKMTVGLIR